MRNQKYNKYIIIIMDQLSLKPLMYQLAPHFANKYKKMKVFTITVQNHQLLMVLTAFLSVSQLLTFASLNKDMKKLIQKSAPIQNRILKAQVQYLTEQELRKLQNSKFNFHQHSAYSLIESYLDNLAWTSFSTRIPKQLPSKNNKNLSNLPISFIMTKLFSKQKQNSALSKQIQNKQHFEQGEPIKAKTTTDKQKQKWKERLVQNDGTSLNIDWYLQNDKEYQQLEKWSAMAREKQHQETMKKLHKYKQMPVEDRKKLVIENFSKFYNDKGQFQKVQILPIDESLIDGNQTFWDRLRAHFTQK